jgi:hypothetical protein
VELFLERVGEADRKCFIRAGKDLENETFQKQKKLIFQDIQSQILLQIHFNATIY